MRTAVTCKGTAKGIIFQVTSYIHLPTPPNPGFRISGVPNSAADNSRVRSLCEHGVLASASSLPACLMIYYEVLNSVVVVPKWY